MAIVDDFIELQTCLGADEFDGARKTAPKDAIESLAEYVVKVPTRFLSIGGTNMGMWNPVLPIMQYDLATKKWSESSFPSINIVSVGGFSSIQAVMLPGQKFMVCSVRYNLGTNKDSPHLAKAFIFNPYATDPTRIFGRVWGPGEKVYACRDGASLLSLSGGRVLRLGGVNSAYDPALAAWGNPQNMIHDVKRDDWKSLELDIPLKINMACAVLQSGEILVTGGSFVEEDRIIRSPRLNLENSDQCYIIDPTLTTVRPTGSMIRKRQQHAACVMQNGHVFVCGGVNEDEQFLVTCEEYDPATGTWSILPDMPVVMIHHTCTLTKDGTIFIAGGDARPIGATMMYDPSTKDFTPLEKFPDDNIRGFKVVPFYD